MNTITVKLPADQAVLVTCLLHDLRVARAKHPQPYVDAHHALGVLLEEVRKIETEVFKRRVNTEHLQRELLDTAVVCLRAIEDLTLPAPKPKSKHHEGI